MKKNYVIIFIVLLFVLTRCGAKVTPIEGIDINDYELLFEDDFEIYILKEIPTLQFTIGIIIEELENETCYLAPTTTNAYIVKYDDNFISLRNGVELKLFDTYNLMDYGVMFQCHDDRK
jgi:hypothetical protein